MTEPRKEEFTKRNIFDGSICFYDSEAHVNALLEYCAYLRRKTKEKQRHPLHNHILPKKSASSGSANPWTWENYF